MKFKLEVFVSRRPHMRDDNLEMMLYIGRNILENLFDKEEVDEHTKQVQMWFPERWCNIVEERSLLLRLERLYPNLELVQIMTQSVYLIQCTPAASCFICKDVDPLPSESLYGKLWLRNHNVPDFSKLQVMQR